MRLTFTKIYLSLARPSGAALRAVLGLALASCALAPHASPQTGPAQTKPPAAAPAESPRTAEGTRPSSRAHYRVDLDLDFDARTYAGTALVRWTNGGTDAASALYFNLYPNLRAPAEPREKAPGGRETAGGAAGVEEAGEPRLEVTEVRAGGGALQFASDDGVTMRVQLREAVPPGGVAQLEMAFRGSVPELDPDQTSLSAHLIQQVGAVLRDTQEVRSGRDFNFFSRGIMLLGAPFPVLAAGGGSVRPRRVEAVVGGHIHADPADYEVALKLADDRTNVYTSGAEESDAAAGGGRRVLCRGQHLRGFALAAGRTLRSAAREVEGVSVRAVFAPEHERTARRVLDAAAEAVCVYTTRFGPLPFKSVTVTEAPLVAGHGSAEFAGLSAIASAFYADFDAPAMRGLPEIVREQRASVEDSLEFAAAHMVAHQWWGTVVGSDPAREPVLDEALAHWSALQYFRDVRGPERAQGALDDQLRGVYQVYRSFGGEDMPADRPARDYRNSFQYAAIVAAKGALMLEALKGVMGEQRFGRGLRAFYGANRLGEAAVKDLRKALFDESDTQQRRMIARVFERWLNERHGDEDVAPPNPELTSAVGVSVERSAAPVERSRFARLGKFFWRQMTRIR